MYVNRERENRKHTALWGALGELMCHERSEVLWLSRARRTAVCTLLVARRPNSASPGTLDRRFAFTFSPFGTPASAAGFPDLLPARVVWFIYIPRIPLRPMVLRVIYTPVPSAADQVGVRTRDVFSRSYYFRQKKRMIRNRLKKE